MIGRTGAIAAMMAALFLPGTARAEWRQATTRHFTVYSEAKPSQLEGFATKLEKFDGLLRLITDTRDDGPVNPVQIFMLSDDGDVRALTHNPDVAGFYSTSDRWGYAVLSREPKAWRFGLGPEEVLFHEYAHHFMLHYFPAAYPAWYVEGFAEFYSVVTFDAEGHIEFGKVPLSRVPTLRMMSIMPLKKLMSGQADWHDPRQTDRFYGTAWLLTHYLHYTPNRQAEFARYLRALTSGQKDADPDIFFNGGIAALEKELRAYLGKGRVSATRVTPAERSQGQVALASMDPVRAALIDEELKLLVGVREKDRPALLADVRSATAKFPSSAHAAALLALAEWRGKNKDAALAAADRAIALDPKLARAHSLRADIFLDRAHDSDRAEDWKAALSAIVKANRADMEDPVPLTQFYRYHRMKGGKMPDVGYDGLNKALALLPQNPRYRLALARALAVRGDYARASLLLDPLAYSPHPSPLRETALKLKVDYDAGRSGSTETESPIDDDAPDDPS
jgi:Flp pilus assembly protein TadD